jgi:hypothetical protein
MYLVQQWWAFRAWNSATVYGYGTQDEAERYADKLNAGREINVYAAHALGSDDATDAVHRDDGFNLEDEVSR